ncbi:tetratricopeptide repeat protein [Thalassoglobus sp. JC818]|uniref:tetratricopeptide repeat protein n=1 Tax=Thalassoglobus sp. JC818 TaxID=3232136 RepID=UPI0034574C5A
MILEQAVIKYEAGDFDSARKLTKQFLHQNEHDGRGWELLGLIQYRSRQFPSSVSALEQASLYIPLRIKSRTYLALGYGEIGKHELSRDLLIDLIADPAISVALLIETATGLDSIGRPDLAVDACRKATERDPDNAQAYYSLSYYVARAGLTTAITESLARHAISLDPTNARYRVGLAGLLMSQDRHPEAYELVKSFDDEQLSGIHCKQCLGRMRDLYQQAGDHDRMILCREKIMELETHEMQGGC